MILALGLLAVACDPRQDLGERDLGEPGVEFREWTTNAQVLNSAVLNGIQFNGIQFNGIQFNGIQYNGIQYNGIQFNGIQFNGSSFTGVLDDGSGPVQKTGLDFKGAELKLATAGATYTLRFDDIRANPDQPDAGVYFYRISWRDDAVGVWSSLCHDHAGDPVEAIPIANHWDMTTGARTDASGIVTFACRGAVLAKCVEWGYVPWATSLQCDHKGNNCTSVSLRDHHQACTRMARADYCGDGHSYTFDGTPIDLFDRLSPNKQTRTTDKVPGWMVEAEWGPKGATCIGDTLRMEMYDAVGRAYDFPGCIDDLDGLPGCGKFDKARPTSLIANSYCDVWTTDPNACAAGDDKPPPPPPPKKK